MLLVSQRIEAPRMEPYLPLQGSIKRKLEDDSSPGSSGINDIIFSNDNKRLCLDDVTLPMGQTQSTGTSCSELQHSPFSTNQNSAAMGVPGHPVMMENNHMNGRNMASPYSVPQNTEMGQKAQYEEKTNNLQSVDQELQDLLEELTKMPDPSPNDLDLEKILGSKSEEPLGISHSQPSLSTTPKVSPQTTSHLDNHITSKDFTAGCNSVSAASPQIRPSSAGTNYPVVSSNKQVQSPILTGQTKTQTQSMLPVSMSNMPGTNWHAQQLKQLAASKQGTSGKQQVQPSSWPTISPTGLSPTYRPGSSPQQPFSPQNVMVSGMTTNSLQGNNMQGSQSSLLSSITSTSNPTSRPSPPYVSEKISSPALNQQPFSPQNSLLTNMSSSNISANTIKSPQNNIVTNMTPANAGPSPPYQPEKLSSPALHQQPFSPQNALMPNIPPSNSQPSMQSSLYKSLSTNQSKNLNMIMQQPSNGLQPGIVNETPVGHDQFSFNNTKPLSHFAPDSAGQKMNLSPGPGSLIHYLQQQHQNPSVQQPQQQVNNNQFLQQQIRQLMQPTRMQRQIQPSSLTPQARQDPSAGIVPRLQEPGSIPSAGPGSGPPTANGYIRNAILKEQIMRRQQQQQLQVKHRPNIMGVTSEQRSSFVAQQMNQFQTLPQTLRPDCVQPMSTASQNHRMITSPQGLMQSSMGSGIAPTPINQNNGPMVMIPPNAGKQQGMFPVSSEFNILLRQNQNALNINSSCQTVHNQSSVRPGITLSGYTSSSITNHPAAQQHLRQSSISRIPNVYSNSSSQIWTQAGVSRLSGQNQLDASVQQFPNNPVFSKQNMRPNLSGQQFPHQAVIPPNQIAPGVQIRQMQKLGLAQANQGVGSINSPNLGNSLSRGQIAAINAMKAMPQGMSAFNQMNPGQLGPPSYGPSPVQAPESFERMSSGPDLHQYEFISAQNNSMLSANCNEADFIDCLMKGGNSSNTDEDWLHNLTILDDILGQHSQNPGPV
ncbi:hypothetical protein GDO86_015293 [Hymenochirus boettgeri]|uniref:Mastermind-like domain-containing protein 1 n=1 Tax=Hymenochirus boettgeri TaxID=247094 RepID=A0A8T2JSC5_9PIPI|nr:hypothetical protein GDO86_015293 [Hymenochirus boettgeri]